MSLLLKGFIVSRQVIIRLSKFFNLLLELVSGYFFGVSLVMAVLVMTGAGSSDQSKSEQYLGLHFIYYKYCMISLIFGNLTENQK